MSVTVNVNGQSGPSVVAGTGDTVVASVTAASAVSVTASPAAAPGGTGPQGPAGPPYTTIVVGNTTTLSAGSSASVVGTSSNNGANLSLAFGIPAGVAGATGPAPTITATASTLSAGSSVTVTATPSNGGANVALAFGIPRGADGSGGGSNLTLSDATPSNLGTAAAGSSNLAARADHIHLLPSLSTLGAAAAAHGHNYVTSLNNLTGGLTLAAGGNVTITSANSTLTIAASGGGLGANDAVDGGDYVGEVVGPSVTITSQPANATAYLPLTLSNLSASNVSGGTVGSDCVYYGSQYLSLTNGSVVKSTNGTTWSTLYSLGGSSVPGSIATSGNTIVVQATNFSSYTQQNANGTSTQVYYNQLEAYTSTDAGQSFTKTFDRSANGRVSVNSGRSQIAYGGGKFVMISTTTYGTNNTSTTFLSSSDGLTWTERSVPVPSGLVYLSIAYGGGKFVAVGSAGSGTVAVSTDGISWTQQNSTVPVQSIAYGNNKFVALSQSSPGSVRVTSDGTNWTTYSLPSGVYYDGSIVFAGGLFIAFGGGVDAAVSSDGQTWTYREMPSSDNWSAAASNGNQIVLVQYGDGTKVAVGTIAQAGTTSAVLSVAASASSGVAAFQWQVSTDAGSTWSSISGATSSTLSLTGLTASDSGKYYRAVISATGATTVNSQFATLTVS